MALPDYLSAEDVRRVNIAILEDASAGYMRSGPFRDLSRRDVLQRIRNVRDAAIRRNIRAVTEFEPGRLESAWSHHMAVNAGTHLWPDANHRTALIGFGLALERAFDSSATLEPSAAERLVRESKRMRDTEFVDRKRYYTVAELADPDHPYRRLFASFEPRVIFGPE